VELARNLAGMSNALINGGLIDAAREAATRAREIAAEAGDQRTEASAIGNLATVSYHAGQLDDAESGFREAIRLFKRVGDEHAVVIGLGNLGELALRRGDVAASVAQHRLGVEAAQQFGDPGLLSWEKTNLAQVLGRTDEWLEGLQLLPDAIASLLETQDDRAAVQGIAIAAQLLRAGDDLTSAAEAWTAAGALSTSLGLQFDVEPNGIELALRQRLGEAYDAAERRTAGLSLEAAAELTIDHMRALIVATEGARR
jgi:tetratricopeptide (TPR) repeat protein